MPVGPIVTSQAARSAELDVSLLERLFERFLYAQHLQARSIAFTHSPGRQNSNFTPFTNLVKVCDLRFLTQSDWPLTLNPRTIEAIPSS